MKLLNKTSETMFLISFVRKKLNMQITTVRLQTFPGLYLNFSGESRYLYQVYTEIT